jgi:hypothetical protein
MRADLRVERGAAPGLSACYIDPSVASPLHATRIQTLQAALDARWTEKVNRYRPVFGNHYPSLCPRTVHFIGPLKSSWLPWLGFISISLP